MGHPSVTIEVEPLTDQIVESYRRLLPHQVADGRAFLDWKFELTPTGKGLFSVARHEGQIIGLSAYLRLGFKLGDKVGAAFQAIDSVVDPAFQGRGLFTQLASRFSDTAAPCADVIWGFPNANAAPAWFGKLGWRRHGFAPFLIKPLRSGILTRRLGLPSDIRLSLLRDRGDPPVSQLDPGVDEVWRRFSHGIDACVDRGHAYLTWRLFEKADRGYRVVRQTASDGGALIATTISEKHGGRIGYVMEAFGGATSLPDALRSEVGRLADHGAELALAWCHPWSPNYAAYRRLGFMPLPEGVTPIKIHVGSRAYSPSGALADNSRGWYLSYLDSDTN